MTQQRSSGGTQPNAAPGDSQGGASAGQGATEQAKAAAGQLTEQAQQRAGQAIDTARREMATRLTSQKDRAAEGLGSVADALRQTGQQLREHDQAGVTGYFDQAASQVERLSSYLEGRDLGQLVDDVEGLARRQPALFLGGAFVLGLLGARFLKSSRPAPRYSGYRGGTYATQRQGYDTGYPGEQDIRAASYGPGMRSGPYATAGRSAMYGAGPRTYDRRREE